MPLLAWKRLALAGLALALAPLAAAAATVAPARVGGVDVLLLSGEIRAGDLKRVSEALAAAGQPPAFLALDSDGGALEEGMAVARLLRERGIGTVVGPRARCHSACAMIFFGGYDRSARVARRVALPGARIGVHRPRLASAGADRENLRGSSVNQVYEVLQQRVADQIRFMNEVEMPPRVQERLFATSHDSIHILTRAELASAGVVVMTRAGDAFTPPEGLDRRVALPFRVDDEATTGGLRQPADKPDRKAERAALGAGSGAGGTQRHARDPGAVAMDWTRQGTCLETRAREADGPTLRVCFAPTGVFGALTLAGRAVGDLSLEGGPVSLAARDGSGGERVFRLDPVTHGPTFLIYRAAPAGFRDDHVVPVEIVLNVGRWSTTLRVPDSVSVEIRGELGARGLLRRSA